jgi:hypothetical protein
MRRARLFAFQLAEVRIYGRIYLPTQTVGHITTDPMIVAVIIKIQDWYRRHGTLADRSSTTIADRAGMVKFSTIAGAAPLRHGPD